MSRRFKDFEEEFDRKRDEQRHGTRPSRDPGERRSWREIDRKRDTSSHSSQNEEAGGRDKLDRYSKAQSEKALMGELNSLFADNEKDGLEQAILKAEDKGALQLAIEAYLDTHDSLPGDPQLLERCLDTRKDRTLGAVVESIAAALPDLADEHRKVLLLKMRNKARTSFDRKVSRTISGLLEKYGTES